MRGTKIVLDCANGACYKAAPKLLKELGAKVVCLGVKPNGLNINEKCGSTFPKKFVLQLKNLKQILAFHLMEMQIELLCVTKKAKS